MIAYTTVGTNNINQATAFYDEVFSVLNTKKVYDVERFVGWKFIDTDVLFAVATPFDGNAASVGNGVMIGLNVGNKDAVEQAHAKALSLGGVCEGEPGIRQDHFYCGYCRDLDGNKLLFYCLCY